MPAMVSAAFIASSIRLAAGTTRATSPQRSASAASIMRPVRFRSIDQSPCFRSASSRRPRSAASPPRSACRTRRRRTRPASASSASGRSANSSNRYLANEPGPIKDDRGRTIGEHVGLSFYTLGQRKGIGIGGLKERGAARGGERPRALVRRPQGHRPEHALRRAGPRPSLAPGRRSSSPTMPAGSPASRRRRAATPRRRVIARPMPPAALPSSVRTARSALALRRAAVGGDAGQSAVLYDGEVCLGGAVIASASMTEPAPVAA